MARFYSPSTGILYWDLLHGDNIPEDAVEFPEEQFQTICEWLGLQKKLVVSQDGIISALDPDPVVLTPEQLAAIERVWRDKEVDRIAWLRDRHRDQVEASLETTLTDGEYVDLLTYIQQLRDWPQSSDFPNRSKRPVPPDWLAGQAQ